MRMDYKKMLERMEWYDVGALKLAVLFFGLWLAKILPAVLGLPGWTYLAIWLILAAYVLWRMYS